MLAALGAATVMATCSCAAHDQTGSSYVPPADPYASNGASNQTTSTVPAISSTSGHFEASWQGYQYGFEFTASYGGVSDNVTHSAPGDAELEFHWNVSVHIANQSSGRDAPAPGRLFNIEGAWPSSSPICRTSFDLDPETSIVREPVGGPDNPYDADSADDANFPYCLVMLGGTSPDSLGAPEITPSGTQTIEATDTYSGQLDQDWVNAALPSLEHGPVFWVSSPGGLSAPASQDDSECAHLLWSSRAVPPCDLQTG